MVMVRFSCNASAKDVMDAVSLKDESTVQLGGLLRT